MPMHRLPRATLAGAAAVACLATAPAGQAADIQAHAITYGVSIEKPPPDIWLDAQISVELTKTCEAWGYSHAWYYGIERNTRGEKPPNQPLSHAATTYQERLKFTEKLDGGMLRYEGSYLVNGRGETATGTATVTGARGVLEVKSDRLPRKVELPEGTILPLALRRKLIAALSGTEAGKTLGPVEVRTLELGRFYGATEVTLAPAPPLPPLRQGRTEVPRLRSPLLQGRAWTLKLTSKDFSDWMESIFELHENGVISRFTFRREGIVWRADAKELNAFTMPTCRK